MSDFAPWLGICHLRQITSDSFDTQPALVAAWADSVEGFEREVHFHTNANNLQMTFADDVLPADDWQAKYPDRKDGQRLVSKVGAKHLIELGIWGACATGLDADGTLIGSKPEYLSITEHSIPNLPDQNNVPFWEQHWIAPELKELLFGASETEACLRTYLIVDATLRKNIVDGFDLDTVDVPVRCLFKGEAAETMKEAAPHLVDMTLPEGAWEDNDLVPEFHKNFFDKHWGQNTGIFVRTTASMDKVWAHFRKFTKVQVEEDKRWVFFRFWDPRIAPFYFESINGWDTKVATWFTKLDQAFIFENPKEYSAIHVKKAKNVEVLPVPFLLTDRELKVLQKNASSRFSGELAKYLKRHYSASFESCDTSSVVYAENLISTAKKLGLCQRGPVFIFSELCVLLGSDFYRDPVFPWAGELIENTRNLEQMELAKQLHRNSCEYIANVYGENNKNLLLSIDKLSQFSKSAKAIEYKNSMTLLYMIYPEKFKYLGQDMLTYLINTNLSLCRKHNINDEYYQSLLLILRFYLGVGYVSDPLFPWIKKAIIHDRKRNVFGPSSKLSEHSLTWLESVMCNEVTNVI